MIAINDISAPLQTFLRELSELPSEAARKQFLASHQQLLNAEVVEQLAEAVHAQVRIDADLALVLADAAVMIARELDNPESLGRSLRAKANAVFTLGKNHEAIELHEQALQSYEKAGNQREIGISLSGSLQPMILLGEYERALAAADRARSIFTALGDARRIARLEINVGNIFHRQDRLEEGLACYERAYEFLRNGDDHEAIAAVLSNLAVCLIALNDFPRALETYQNAREFCEKRGMPLLTAMADYNIAYLYYLRGEYSRAIQGLLFAREACRKNGDTYQLALCHMDLSEIYLELNLSSEAVETAHDAHRLFLEVGTGYEAAKCLANEAIALGQQGQAFRAIELFTAARKEFVAEKNLVWPWLLDLYQALLLCEQGRLFEARRLCQKALSFFSTSALIGKAVLCDLLLARISLRSGDWRAAGGECRSALERLQPLDAAPLAFQAWSLMGEIHRAGGNNEAAYESFQHARAALEKLRSGLRGEEVKIAFLKNKLGVYEGLVEICLERSSDPLRFEEAFACIEEAKSRSLTDLMLQRGPILAGNNTGQSDLVRRIRELREELNWYYHRIDIEQLRPEESSPDRIAKLQEQSKSREEEFLSAIREMQASEENTLESGEGVTLETIRASLPPDATLLEYFMIGDQIVACMLHGDAIEIVGVSLGARVVHLLRMLQFQISKFRLGKEYADRFESSLLEATLSHLRRLHDELIAPIRDKLQGSHVIIVPHGPLHYIPFHALHDGTAYLMDSFTLSYAPSASLFALSQRKPQCAATKSLVLGVPDENAPAILDEVRAVSGVLPSVECFVGQAATLAVLKERGLSSRYIHIATHGEFRHDSPLFSGIRLGDSRLNLYDLYQLHLPAELVALSGCATGLNAVAAGDELLGLVRGLLCAGAQTLLLTLWDIHDQTAADFMKSFYGRLRAGESKPVALQYAMIELREHHPHPCFWAPFILVGKIL
ncbi:MAG: CHAT domain-containing tetratricopeptide repeat protein [Candidatus Acidiferrales bacterium]